MTSTPSAGCIPANPDIAGIGIRASTYAQNFLGVFLATCYLIDGKISRDEADYIESASNAILMTGCAIIISAFIQAKTIGLSVYHAMIVLNLSWMNNTYFSISGIFTVAMNRQGRRRHERKGFRVVQYLGFIHLSLMASFGIWVWLEIDKFGDSPKSINKSLRRVSLTLYWITAIPFVNLLVGLIVALVGSIVAFVGYIMGAFGIVIALLCLVSPLVLLIYILDCYLDRHSKKSHADDVNAAQDTPTVTESQDGDSTHDDDSNYDNVGSFLAKRRSSILRWAVNPDARVGLLYLPFVAFIDVVFTIDTELMVRRSQQFVRPGESQWTFGQTLAVIVTIIPLWEARRCINWKGRTGEPLRAQSKSVSLDYQGNIPLTVNPPISGASTITKGSTTAIDPNSEAYKFSVDGSVVATIRNRSDMNKVKITGGNTVEGTEPFIVTVALK